VFDRRLVLNTFIPPYPGVAFDRFVKGLASRGRVPYQAYIALTARCPYRCEHCSYRGRSDEEMTTDDLRDLIAHLIDAGSSLIGFTGGEPLLRDDVAELVRCASGRCATILFTTGHGLDARLAAELKDAGLTYLVIGLENAGEVVHDRVRGVAGSFREGLEAIRVSQEARLYTGISTVATRERISHGVLDALLDLARRRRLDEFRILEPIPTGGLLGACDEALAPGEVEWLRAFHRRGNRGHSGPTVNVFAHVEADDMFGCGAGFHHVFIDAAGNVCPCDLLPLSFGSVRERPFADIWRDMGRCFCAPRRGCLAKELAGALAESANGRLPIPPETSRRLCSCIRTELPALYRPLLEGRDVRGGDVS
jgi:MoaA/NifB/PqqE/SkfB family radical SAM enzyme